MLAAAMTVFNAVPGPALADFHTSKEAGIDQIAAQFRNICVDTYPGFVGFEDRVAAEGFFPRGDGTFSDGVHNTIFQLWDGPKHLTCTVFYYVSSPDIRGVTERMSLAALRDVGIKNVSYEGNDQRVMMVLDAFSKGIFQHRVMRNQDGLVEFRMMIAVPKGE